MNGPTTPDDPAGWAVRVPASSANLGPGFDALGMALTLHAEIGAGPSPPGALAVDARHPAATAFTAAGGRGPLWVRSPIPMGRGLGYSGAVRVGGALVGLLGGSDGPASPALGPPAPEVRRRAFELAAAAEGHPDNVAASLHGGVTAAHGPDVVRVDVALDPAVVVWIPDATTTSTDRSRGRLPVTVPFAAAVANVGRTALLVAALAAGDRRVLATATEDDLHQSVRFRAVPASAAALAAGRAAGAWCGWLSGSGPSVALLCGADEVDEVQRALPTGGHAKVLRIDRDGAHVVVPSSG